jgi:hypothetical protein
MKIKTLKLTPEQFMRALQGKAIATANLPSDLELLKLKYDLFTRQITAIVQSDSFEDIAENTQIPELSLTPPQTTAKPAVSTTASLIAKLQRPVESKPNLAAPKTQTQMQSSQDTGQMEKEFSADQRKLLKFSVSADGGFVIVKPTQFLKTEWDDINDTVVGLGGRWVKGDIINYWEIPRNQTG